MGQRGRAQWGDGQASCRVKATPARRLSRVQRRAFPDKAVAANKRCRRGSCGPDVRHAQELSGRRRGMDSNRGSLPPSRASRRALSRSINALSPSLIRAVRPFTPERRWASCSSWSSRLRVVRIVRSSACCVALHHRVHDSTLQITIPARLLRLRSCSFR